MKTTILLVILISRGDGSISEFVSPHPSYQSCYAALDRTKIQMSTGSENELGVAAFCANDYAYYSNHQLYWRNK